MKMASLCWKKMRKTAGAKGLCALIGVLLLFPGVPGGANALSLKDETELGREFVEEVRRRFELVEDHYAMEYLRDLKEQLSSGVETQPFPFSFYLIKGNEMNAFAGPGGHIFFFTGLITEMETLEELAAVATHEMAHVTARHVAERIEQGKRIGLATAAGILAGILIGGEAGGAITTGSVAAGAQARLAFSRADERQADQLGFKYMRASGFDPSAMISVLNKMQRGQVYGTDKIPGYLRTHPLGPERIANMESLINRMDASDKARRGKSLRESFPIFQTLLAAKYSDRDSAERRFRRRLREDPDSMLGHFGLGLLAKEESDFQLAVEHLEKARELAPGVIPVTTGLAEAYRMSGRDREAVRLLEQALERRRDSPGAAFLLAESFQNLGRYEEALRLLERLAAVEPVRDKVYYDLGICYGRLDQLAQAHYNFGLYFKKTGERSKARFHFDKAEGLARSDPGLLREIREASADL